VQSVELDEREQSNEGEMNEHVARVS